MDSRRLALVACALAVFTGCHGPDAALLTIKADGKVDAYRVGVYDEDNLTVVYPPNYPSDNYISLPAGTDLSKNPLKIALKVTRAAHLKIAVFARAGSGNLFWAGHVHVDGANGVTANLVAVPATDDADGDLWPKSGGALASTFTPELLDCNDSDPTINPFAAEICGDGIDQNCDGNADEACVDKDGDHDNRGTDCDDNDKKRHHPTDIDPFPDPPNCCGYSLRALGTGKIDPADDHTNFLVGATQYPGETVKPDRTICPFQRCGDGIDESCKGLVNDPVNDTACVVDEDCDGYSPPQDCNDHDANIHPGALDLCDPPTDRNCNGIAGDGCVPCDLDGDGYERSDGKGCPDKQDKHPGMVDCNDDDAGVFPGATSDSGSREGGAGTLKRNASVHGFCRGIYEPTGLTGTPKINPFGGLVGDADCNGKAYEGCPSAACDKDGDGWPNANTPTCNPDNVTLDCDDADPTTFPGAPINCKKTVGTPRSDCMGTAKGASDCAGPDGDGDGYAGGIGGDCDDANAAIHPFAAELCNGKDDNCDGVVDEHNPDPAGKPLVVSGAIAQCTDSNFGVCKTEKGSCVCSSATPQVDPRLLPLNNATRTACSGEGTGDRFPSCFGAGQPTVEKCDGINNDCIDDAVWSAQNKDGFEDCGVGPNQGKATCCGPSPVGCRDTTSDFDPKTGAQYCGVAPVNNVCPMSMCNPNLADRCYKSSCSCGTSGAQCNANQKCVNGVCLNPAGSTCGMGGECQSGNCTDGYCCNLPDCGVCGACNVTPGTCSPQPRFTQGNKCTTAGYACDGAGHCLKDNGQACGGNSECLSLTCVDGVCCDGLCNGQCQACNLAGKLGVCSPVTGAPVGGRAACNTDGSGCGGSCDGANGAACAYPTSQCRAQSCAAGSGGAPATVTNPANCNSGACPSMTTTSCVSYVNCNGANCASSCTVQTECATGFYCTGALCVGKKMNGQSCTAGTECMSNNCIDGYCCDSLCGGQCEACNLAGKHGTCSQVMNAAPVAPRPACASDGTNCGGKCVSSRTMCTYAGATTTCGTMTCTPGTAGTTSAKEQPLGACNGAGSCTSATVIDCMPYTTCNGGACATSCADDNGCITGYYCANDGPPHTCMTQKPKNASCGASDCAMSPCRECANGACNGGGSCP